MTTSPNHHLEALKLRAMLFDVLDYIDPIMDQLVSVDRMHVERIKEMSGWERQPQAEATPYAEVFKPRAGLLGLIVHGANLARADMGAQS